MHKPTKCLKDEFIYKARVHTQALCLFCFHVFKKSKNTLEKMAGVFEGFLEVVTEKESWETYLDMRGRDNIIMSSYAINHTPHA